MFPPSLALGRVPLLLYLFVCVLAVILLLLQRATRTSLASLAVRRLSWYDHPVGLPSLPALLVWAGKRGGVTQPLHHPAACACVVVPRGGMAGRAARPVFPWPAQAGCCWPCARPHRPLLGQLAHHRLRSVPGASPCCRVARAASYCRTVTTVVHDGWGEGGAHTPLHIAGTLSTSSSVCMFCACAEMCSRHLVVGLCETGQGPCLT